MQVFGDPEVMRAHQERAIIAGEVWRHEVRTFMDEISVDHLVTVRKMLNQLACPDSEGLANYWEGMSSAVLDFKHHVCVGCGANHDEDLLVQTQEQIGDDD